MKDLVQRLTDLVNDLADLQEEFAVALTSCDPSKVVETKPDAFELNEFGKKYEYFKQIAEDCGFVSVWSMYDTYPFCGEIPYPNARTVTYKEHWGQEAVVSGIMEEGTWEDIWRAADLCIRASGDSHHIFIEGFKEDGETLILYTGS